MSKKSADFGKWLTRKFLDIQSESGKQWTITEFAEFLNSPQQSVSRWLAGGLPEEARIDKLASILGDEIYEAAGLPRPSISRRIIDKFLIALDDLAPEEREEILRFFSIYTAEEFIYYIMAGIAEKNKKGRGKRGGDPGSEHVEQNKESRGETRKARTGQQLDGEKI